MYRRGEDRIDRSFFDDLAVFHDDDVVAELTRERQVVGDQYERHGVLVTQACQQRQDVALRRDVQGRRRFVSDEDARLRIERRRDGDALAHSARQFVGVRASNPGVESDVRQKRACTL